MTRTVICREHLREGAAECPLCGRQIAAPTDRPIVYGIVARITAEKADAVECPGCCGVTRGRNKPEHGRGGRDVSVF